MDGDGDGQSDLNDVLVSDPSQWLDSDGDGFYDNPNPATNWDDCPAVWGNSTIDLQGCPDSDGDGVSDIADGWPTDPTRSIDTDGDGFADSEDDCPTFAGNSTWILVGCLDADGDGRTVEYDVFPTDPTQWNDTDADGFGDNPGGTLADDCPLTPGDSWQNGTLGCPDSDGDGWADSEDSFIDDATQWHDIDGDGYGDNIGGTNPDYCPTEFGNSTQGGVLGCPDADGDGWSDSIDALPNDDTQYSDQDGDGFGDNPDGNNADDCPLTFGNSTIDRLGCIDSDGDGHSDVNDDFPLDPTRHKDSDGDGFDDVEDDCIFVAGTSTNGSIGCFDSDQDTWADNDDSFPVDGTQWNDTDNDGFGDNSNGNNPDSCPTVTGNSTSVILGCVDIDGDTWADSIDEFPTDSSEWADNDSDGFGDNIDYCPFTPGTSTNGAIGCLDDDGDSWSNNHDFLPDDETQWLDSDSDGFGDNTTGTNGDDCPFEPGYSSNDFTGCPDDDLDGWSNGGDAFPDTPSQYLDTDGDGYGDNNTPGSEKVDHWPDDPTRNVAEAILECTPRYGELSDNGKLELDLAEQSNSDLAVNCLVTNLIETNITVKVEWIRHNSISIDGSSTRVMELGGLENGTVRFSGIIEQKGDIDSVFKVSELGVEDAMEFDTIEIKAINSDDGDSFDNILDKAKEVLDVQELIAVAIALALALFLTINSIRNSKKKKAEREERRNQYISNSFVMDESPLFGRIRPPN